MLRVADESQKLETSLCKKYNVSIYQPAYKIKHGISLLCQCLYSNRIGTKLSTGTCTILKRFLTSDLHNHVIIKSVLQYSLLF